MGPAMFAHADSVSYAGAMEQLVDVVRRLSLARDLDSVMEIVRRAARTLTGADGATFVLRDNDLCFYDEEDEIEPLWKGQRFPMSACISGWAMLNKASAVLQKPVTLDDLSDALRRIGLPGRSVLVIDDDAHAREIASTGLGHAGFSVLCAKDGEEGIALARTHLPDLVVLDRAMPGLNGFEGAERLRQDARTADLPIVVLTAKALGAEERAALEGRVRKIMEKFDRKEFIREVRRVMATILIVEDNPRNMKLGAFLLESAGHRVLQAGDAASGIDIVRSGRPDLVLMGIQLPGMDGLSATRALKGDPLAASAPIYALTAFAMKGDEERMREAGCDGYIAKPIRHRYFLETVGRAFGGMA